MTDKPEPSHHGVKEELQGSYPNDTIRLLIERASCRSFQDKIIPDEVMELILQAGTRAATGGNLQPWSIIRIDSQESRDELARLCFQPFMATAPTHLLFCIDWHRLWRWANLEGAPFTANESFRHFWISFQDVVIAAQTISTAADALGLGSVYIGTVMESVPTVAEMFELPQGVFPVVLLCLGYPKGRPSPRKKLATEVLVHKEKYMELDDGHLIKAYNEKYPDLKLELTTERKDTLQRVCENVNDKEFARETLSRISEQGYINAVQRYFGLHYVADEMCLDNEMFVRQSEALGFRWFSESSLESGSRTGSETESPNQK